MQTGSVPWGAMGPKFSSCLSWSLLLPSIQRTSHLEMIAQFSQGPLKTPLWGVWQCPLVPSLCTPFDLVTLLLAIGPAETCTVHIVTKSQFLPLHCGQWIIDKEICKLKIAQMPSGCWMGQVGYRPIIGHHTIMGMNHLQLHTNIMFNERSRTQ